MKNLLSDFNAKVVSEGIFKRIIENEISHKISNGNGDSVAKFAMSKHNTKKYNLSSSRHS
jgi:hypothetical protein